MPLSDKEKYKGPLKLACFVWINFALLPTCWKLDKSKLEKKHAFLANNMTIKTYRERNMFIEDPRL